MKVELPTVEDITTAVRDAVRAELAGIESKDRREFLTLSKLARELGKGRSVVSRWAREGIIPSVDLPDGTTVYHLPSVTAALIQQFERGAHEDDDQEIGVQVFGSRVGSSISTRRPVSHRL